MAVLQDLLQRLADTLRITHIDPPIGQIGQFMRFSLGPDPGLLRAVDPDLVDKDLALDLTGTLTGSVVSPAMNTTGTLTDIAGTTVNNIQATTQAGTGDISIKLQDAASVLPSLSGPLPVPIELPLTVAVKWGAYRYVRRKTVDTNQPHDSLPDLPLTPLRGARERIGAALAAESLPPGLVTDAIIPFEREELRIGKDFIAPGGLNLIDLALLFAPSFVELTVKLPSLEKIFVYAEVTLSVPDQPSVTRTIEAVVLLPPLAIPKLIALFRYPYFNMDTEDGVPRKGPATLLVVPADSPLGSYQDLATLLATLKAVLAPLRNIARIAKFLLGLNLLGAALSRRPRLRFVVADKLIDLHRIKLIKYRAWQDPWVNDAIPDFTAWGGWPGDDDDNDLYAGDVMSSLIFLGPPDSSVECFLLRYLNEVPPFGLADVHTSSYVNEVLPVGLADEHKPNGHLQITAGAEGIVLVRSLAYPADAETPSTDPAGQAEVHTPPDPHKTGFDNRISSMRF